MLSMREVILDCVKLKIELTLQHWTKAAVIYWFQESALHLAEA